MTELKKQGLKSKEIANGFAYKFKGGDGVIDQLSEFIKTEHHCCAFLKFNLFIGKESECN